MTTRIKTAQEIISMRAGGKVLAGTLSILASSIYDGISANEINVLAEKEIKRAGMKAAFLGFQGFPASVCVSVNNEVVHGIPTKDKIIRNGDVVSLDLGILHGGMIVDGAISLLVGDKQGSADTAKLLRTTKLSLEAGISTIKAGCKVGDISSVIQKELEENNLGIVRELVGHGVGHELHEEPNIPNYGKKGKGMQLSAGMTIAVEPMATLGEGDIYIDQDGWTVKTKDGSVSAQFEHTVLVTESGAEILTTP
jgi:methionyl aminopeptidase